MKLSELIEAMGGSAVGLTHDPELYVYDGEYGVECAIEPNGVQFVVNGLGAGATEKLIFGRSL